MKKNIMLVDMGGTSGRWLMCQENGWEEHASAGFNPLQSSWSDLETIAQEISKNINIPLNTIDFYGAGFVNDSQQKKAKEILLQYFSVQTVNVYSDIYLVDRATPNSTKKVVIILGTGCSSMFCQDDQYIQSAPALGFAIGDDGSGAYMGRALLRTYFYNQLDDFLKSELESFQNMNRIEILDRIYRSEGPSAYLASLFPFILKHKSHRSISSLIASALQDHIDNIASQYPRDAIFHYSGSVAWYLKEELSRIFAENELYLGKIIKEPLQEIIKSIQKK